MEIDENCIQRMGEILKEEEEKLKGMKRRRELERSEKERNGKR